MYVLWAYREGPPVNEHALAPVAGQATTVVLEDADAVSELAVTVEPRGDATEPSGPVVAHAELRSDADSSRR